MSSPTARSLCVEVIGIPKGSPRPRARARGKHAQVYMPPLADDWKACVREAVARLSSEPIAFGGPIELSIEYRLPLGKSREPGPRSKRVRPYWQTKKPDLDNADKATMDALTQAGVWHDDAQVCVKRSMKRYAKPGEYVGATIGVTQLEADNG